MIKDQNEKNKIKDQIVHLAFIIFLGLNSILSSQSNILTFYYSLSTLFRLFSFFSIVGQVGSCHIYFNFNALILYFVCVCVFLMCCIPVALVLNSFFKYIFHALYHTNLFIIFNSSEIARRSVRKFDQRLIRKKHSL